MPTVNKVGGLCQSLGFGTNLRPENQLTKSTIRWRKMHRVDDSIPMSSEDGNKMSWSYLTEGGYAAKWWPAGGGLLRTPEYPNDATKQVTHLEGSDRRVTRVLKDQ